MKTVKALQLLALQCSMYSDGKRWCEFCGKELLEPPFVGHAFDCPVYEIRRALEFAEAANTASNKPSTQAVN